MVETSVLPDGVALVRVDTPVGRLMLASSKLTDEEQRQARLVAAVMAARGRFSAVVLRFSDLLRAVDDA